MKVIAIIPARAGSKGLPGKNLLPLAGKPLLAHSIQRAKDSGVCDVVLVTTEDEGIADVARRYGAEVPFLRPAELADDTTPAEPVIRHALVTYEAMTGQLFDIVVYLQPTDVFRTPDIIRQCVERLKQNPNLDSVFAAYKTHKNYWRESIHGGYERVAPDLATYQSRQFRKGYLYREDAGLASANRAQLAREGKRIGEKVDLVITEDFCTAIDIHSPLDFWLAEKLMTEWNGQTNGWGAWLGRDPKSWIQGIRNGYTRAFILFALHETGVFEALDSGPAKTVEELAAECRLDPVLLDGVLNYLTYADAVLQKEGEHFSLTHQGRWLFEDSTLAMAFGAVGSYACLLTELVPALRGQKRYGVDFERRGDLLAKGSYYTGRGNYPWLVSQLGRLGVRTVADLGCGSADVLIEFCKLDSRLKGVGIDISSQALRVAQARIDEAGLGSRIRLVQGDLTHPETFGKEVQEVEAFNGTMVLHEFLREGEAAVEEILRRMKQHFPKKYFLLGEFNRVSDQEFKNLPYPDRVHPLFYQYIIHPLTRQGMPLPKEQWLNIFKKADLRLLLVKDDLPFRLVEYLLQF